MIPTCYECSVCHYNRKWTSKALGARLPLSPSVLSGAGGSDTGKRLSAKELEIETLDERTADASTESSTPLPAHFGLSSCRSNESYFWTCIGASVPMPFQLTWCVFSDRARRTNWSPLSSF